MNGYDILGLPVDIHIEEENGLITKVQFGKKGDVGEKTPVLLQCERELREYFFEGRRDFSVKLNPQGTDFQKRVWERLRKIPYGEARSYGEIAAAIGCKGGARAVGNANNKNPIAIIVPCHRVIGANGKLVGYAGGLNVKEMLLFMERKNVDK